MFTRPASQEVSCDDLRYLPAGVGVMVDKNPHEERSATIFTAFTTDRQFELIRGLSSVAAAFLLISQRLLELLLVDQLDASLVERYGAPFW